MSRVPLFNMPQTLEAPPGPPPLPESIARLAHLQSEFVMYGTRDVFAVGDGEVSLSGERYFTSKEIALMEASVNEGGKAGCEVTEYVMSVETSEVIRQRVLISYWWLDIAPDLDPRP
jgi:hypothetical protein